MKPQIQPNKWSCLPTAFAIATGRSTNDLITALMHDGTKCDRVIGFSPQEIIWQLKDQWHICEYNSGVLIDDQGVFDDLDLAPPSMPSLQDRFNELSKCVSGIYAYTTFGGSQHCVVWDHIGKVFIDPKNGDNLHSVEGEVEVFWSVEPRCELLSIGEQQDQRLRESRQG